MTVKQRISLNAENSLGYGYLVYCCGRHQPIHIDQMEIGDRWECMYCENPLLLRTQKGFFLVGHNVTI